MPLSLEKSTVYCTESPIGTRNKGSVGETEKRLFRGNDGCPLLLVLLVEFEEHPEDGDELQLRLLVLLLEELEEDVLEVVHIDQLVASGGGSWRAAAGAGRIDG